jgi:hypothetical protein
MSTLMLKATIRPGIKRWLYIKSGLIAATLMSSIWVFELALPWLGVESGGIGWLLRGAAVGTGWVPLLKLTKQPIQPNLLHANIETISLYRDEEELFTLPWAEVATFSFIDKGSTYGIAITLKSPQAVADVLQSGKTVEELPLLIDGLETIAKKELAPAISSNALQTTALTLPEPIQKLSKKSYGVDLFLPYFSEPSYQLLKQWREETIAQNCG